MYQIPYSVFPIMDESGWLVAASSIQAQHPSSRNIPTATNAKVIPICFQSRISQAHTAPQAAQLPQPPRGLPARSMPDPAPSYAEVTARWPRFSPSVVRAAEEPEVTSWPLSSLQVWTSSLQPSWLKGLSWRRCTFRRLLPCPFP